MKVVTSAEMRELEEASARQGLTTDKLMENAGRAVAEATRVVLGGAKGKRVVVLVGPGNNGGDGLVAARYLQGGGAQVSLYLCAPRQNDANLKALTDRALEPIPAEGDADQVILADLLQAADAALDAVFGTGQSRAIAGLYRAVLLKLMAVKQARPALKIIAVDLPSGLSADTGAADPATPYADATITLGLPKRGLYTPSGAEHAGEVQVADIGLPPGLADNLPTALMSEAWARPLLPVRSPYAHKGSFGRALVVAGSANYIGAAYLACAGAVRVGAGLVTLAVAQSLQPIIAGMLPEAVYIPLPEAAPGVIAPVAAALASSAGEFSAVLVGCGLGQRAPVKEFTEYLLSNLKDVRLIVDADGLNTLAGISEWWQRLPFDAILTPHPGEMARLAGLSTEEVQADRLGLAQAKAREWQKTIVLKGAFTVVAAPDGRSLICPTANAGLATAGTGDVLAGVIAGLLAQGLGLFTAASLGVFLHAAAGARVTARLGETGVAASDLLPELPLAVKAIRGE